MGQATSKLLCLFTFQRDNLAWPQDPTKPNRVRRSLLRDPPHASANPIARGKAFSTNATFSRATTKPPAHFRRAETIR